MSETTSPTPSIKRANSKTLKKLPAKKSNKKTTTKAIKKANKKTTKKPIKKSAKITDIPSDFEDKIEEIREALRENYSQQKKLMNDLKVLMSLHKKEVKTATKMKKGSAGKLSGFNKPEHIPESLRELLDIEDQMLPRSKVSKILYKYIEDNDMYNTNTKREIIPNKEMKKIFGIKKGDSMTFYNFQTWLKKVYDKDNNARLPPTDNILVVDD